MVKVDPETYSFNQPPPIEWHLTQDIDKFTILTVSINISMTIGVVIVI